MEGVDEGLEDFNGMGMMVEGMGDEDEVEVEEEFLCVLCLCLSCFLLEEEEVVEEKVMMGGLKGARVTMVEEGVGGRELEGA